MHYFVKLWNNLHIRSDLITLIDIAYNSETKCHTVVVEAQAPEMKRESFILNCQDITTCHAHLSNILSQLNVSHSIAMSYAEPVGNKEEKATEKNLGFRMG